jgi:hypothetical protein
VEFLIQLGHVGGIRIRVDAVKDLFGVREVGVGHPRNRLGEQLTQGLSESEKSLVGCWPSILRLPQDQSSFRLTIVHRIRTLSIKEQLRIILKSTVHSRGGNLRSFSNGMDGQKPQQSGSLLRINMSKQPDNPWSVGRQTIRSSRNVLFIISHLCVMSRLLSALPSYAQKATGGIQGTLTDTSGAAVPSATITLRQLNE